MDFILIYITYPTKEDAERAGPAKSILNGWGRALVDVSLASSNLCRQGLGGAGKYFPPLLTFCFSL
jgi:hypothetical protein